MADVLDQIDSWVAAIEGAQNTADLENLKQSHLGKSSYVSQQMGLLAQLDADAKKQRATVLNQVKKRLQDALSTRALWLKEQDTSDQLAREAVDTTLPPITRPIGRFHPLTAFIQTLTDFFTNQGFTVLEGPEIEDEWHNFDALNIPVTHPARQNLDTFFLQDNAWLLRSQTSSVQIRALHNMKLPLRMISLGRVYRADHLDATHTPMFHQIEGLVIDRDIHMGHMRGLIHDLCHYIFDDQKLDIRLRPSFFPFTEPSAEVDIAYVKKTTKERSWLEVMGCGMVHPNVLKNCGHDPEEYQGFAFGAGIERLCMLKYGFNDIRPFYQNHKRWIDHFGVSTL